MEPRPSQVLKRDALGRVELVEVGGEWRVRRVACGGRLPLSAWVARKLLARERRALAALRGLEGVPPLLEQAPQVDVLERGRLPGEPLHRAKELPLDFFERLEALVRAMHARGVAHNDLHKEQNVIVLPDGAPGLIDFQLASVHRLPSRLLERRALDDLRHIAKHRRRYLRFARVVDARVAPPPELLAAPPRAPQRRGIARVWRVTGKPLYNFVTRRVLGRRDGEERRALHDEWPVWTAATRPRR